MSNAVIARLQRRHLAELAHTQPSRALLVQPLRDDPASQKLTRWRPWTELAPGQEVWTRSVLLNELLFDADARPWRRVARAVGQLSGALEELGVPRHETLSGGKGAHVHVWIDADSLSLPGSLADRARALEVDPWSVARMVLAGALLDAAGFPEAPKLRWAPPHGVGVWDRSKLKWDAARRGSMVRVLGTPGRAGFRKTLVPEGWSWEAARPAAPPLRWAFGYEPWTVPRALRERVAAATERAVAVAESRRPEPPAVLSHGAAAAQLARVPCAARTLTEPVPPGSRHYAFLNLIVSCHRLGMSREDARATLLRALERSGLPPTDPAVEIVEDVYGGRYRVEALACPSPHVEAWCNPNACALARRYVFPAR